jgi:ATP-dependent protease HslVU (ClpYQ) peptidase subunit
MSVVAWDGKTLAADKQGTIGDVAITVTKLWKLNDGTVLGGVGDAFEAIGLRDWYMAGADPAEFDPENETILIVAKDGECKFLAQLPVFMPVEDPFMAWGAGADIALGAMMMGAGAVRAVGIVCGINVACGCGVDSFPCGKKRSKK